MLQPLADREATSIQANLTELATGFWISRTIYVAAKLGIADLLAHGPQSARQLAAKTNTNSDALYRLLRTLAAIGLFVEHADGQFSSNDTGSALRSDSDGTLYDYVMMLGQAESWRAWEHIEHAIKTGEPAFERAFGLPLFQYLANNPRPGQIFDRGMRSRGAADDDAIVAAYNFSAFSRIVDVGGGAGRLLSSILKLVPHAKGTLFDAPHVIEAASVALEQSAICDRMELVGGDFFDAVPAGADLYLLKQIVHDWGDEQATKLLTNCRRAMSATSRLLIVEVIIEADSVFAKLLDLMMLVATGGRERTRDEYEHLLSKADLKSTRVISTCRPIRLIEIVPANAH